MRKDWFTVSITSPPAARRHHSRPLASTRVPRVLLRATPASGASTMAGSPAAAGRGRRPCCSWCCTGPWRRRVAKPARARLRHPSACGAWARQRPFTARGCAGGAVLSESLAGGRWELPLVVAMGDSSRWPLRRPTANRTRARYQQCRRLALRPILRNGARRGAPAGARGGVLRGNVRVLAAGGGGGRGAAA